MTSKKSDKRRVRKSAGREAMWASLAVGGAFVLGRVAAEIFHGSLGVVIVVLHSIDRLLGRIKMDGAHG